jgi:transposase
MRTKGTAQELETRRRLAVQRVHEGWPTDQVAQFLGVTRRAVNGWLARHRADPVHGLDAKPAPGRPPKLDPGQEQLVLSWFGQSPTVFGFSGELWTAQRAATLIERFFGVRFHPHYLSAWLARRRITPQKPQLQPRERDQAAIDSWLAADWVRLKKRPAGPRRRSLSWTNPGR